MLAKPSWLKREAKNKKKLERMTGQKVLLYKTQSHNVTLRSQNVLVLLNHNSYMHYIFIPLLHFLGIRRWFGLDFLGNPVSQM